MSNRMWRFLRVKKRRIAIAFAALLCISAWWIWPASNDKRLLGVLLTGVHHMGTGFYVPRFYVDGYSGGNVGPEGGGGGDVCCVRIPYQWRPGLLVDLRWEVDRWGNSLAADKIPEHQLYRARISIEEYKSPEHLYVHFYADGRARVVSSMVGPGNPDHPADAGVASATRASKGTSVHELFSRKEVSEMGKVNDTQQRWQ